MEGAGWVSTCVDIGDWSMNDREALGDCDLAGVDEKTENLPVLLLFAAIESKSSDALIGKERSVNYQLFSHSFCRPHHFAATSKPRSKHSFVATRSSDATVESTVAISMSSQVFSSIKCKIRINLGK